ncbi:SAGA-associated factor 73 [Fusarium albosuccineum]|uniref:SAGA-associated factor 73 n=1 Tax=Fusarium albosuccineum TaxID=1237068 RepID=A0A8H4LFJ4_9HYPO|nr:SAGA-associated factor 73 [Fusarium albosuccineum]
MGSDARKGEDGTIKVASKNKNGTIKLKKPPPKHSKPGNWRDGSVIEDKKKNGTSPATGAPSPGPVVNQLDENSRETFATGRPLEDSPDLQQCKHCKKSVLKTAAKGHIAQCLRLKKEKAQRKKEAREARERAKEAARQEEARKEDEENGDGKGDGDSDDDGIAAEKKATGSKTAKKAAGKKPDDDKKGKKRKADGDPDKGPKTKKKKDEPKAKVPKPKGPVDVERQCGVILANGQPCARSLTCKSHSMGAKRAVAGRSLPYDMLLAAYQKKNQAKQQNRWLTFTSSPRPEAALDANAPIEDEDDANNGPVDSDEETAAVMSSLAHWKPVPVIPQPTFTPIKRQYQLARLHEQLQMATNGGRTNIFAVNGFGAQRLPEGHPGLHENEDAPGESCGIERTVGIATDFIMSSKQALNALGHAVSGSVGTAISTATLYPLDLVTTRLKAQRKTSDSTGDYDGIISALKGITANEGGIGALYSGLGTDVAKSVFDSFLFFGFYNYLRRRDRKPKIIEELLVGAIAGACARAFTTPISNVVTRKQMLGSDQSLREILAEIREEGGLLGLWSGYSATLVLTLNPSITFFVNRRLAARIIPALEDEDVPIAWIAFLIAASSKAAATAVTYPFQTGKTRLQMASGSIDLAQTDEDKEKQGQSKPKRTLRRMIEFLDQTIFGVILRIIKTEGLRALYAGLRAELLKSFFSHGLTMLTKGVIHRLVIRVWFMVLLPHLRQRRLRMK